MFPYCNTPPPPVNSQDSLQAAKLIDCIWITVPVRVPNVTSLKITSAEKSCATNQEQPIQLERNMLLSTPQTTATSGVTLARIKEAQSTKKG